MRFKVPRLEKMRRRSGLLQKKKKKKNIGKHMAYQEITFFLFLTVINNVSPFP